MIVKQLSGWMNENREKLWFSVLLNGLILGILLLFFYPAYETNDDMAFISLAGGIKGTYDMHLVHIHCLIGWLLSILYALNQGIPWYAIIQYALLFCAFTAITYVLIRRLKHSASLWLILIFLLFFAYEGYIKIQYTKSAGILAVAGFSLLFYALFSEKIPKKAYILGMLLSVAGSMYRYNQFFCEAALFTALGLYFLFQLKNYPQKERIRRFSLCIGTFILLLAVVLVSRRLDRMMYATAEWDEYFQYNSARAELLDYGFPKYSKNEEAYNKLGIDEPAYKLFKDWTHCDSEKITTEVMEQIAELKAPKQIGWSLFKRFFTIMPKGFLKIIGFWCFAVIAVCWLLFNKHSVSASITVLYEVFMVLLVNLYLFYRGRYLMNRVDSGIWMAAAVVVLWLMDTMRWKLFNKAGCLILIVSIAMMQGRWTKNLRAVKGETADHKKEVERSVLEAIDADDEHLYLTKSGTVAFTKGYGVWDAVPFGIGDNMYPLGGWTPQLEVYMNVLDRYDIDNPFRDMIGNEKVYLIDDDIELTMEYINNWYDEDAEAVLVKKLGYYSVYQIK